MGKLPRNYQESMTSIMSELETMMHSAQAMYDYDWNDSSDAAVEAEKLVKKTKKLRKRLTKNLLNLNIIDQLERRHPR